MNLSENFTLQEMTESDAAARLAIDNTPSVTQISNLQKLCVNTLEPIRSMTGGKSILISSGFRSSKLNKAIGGSETSDHCNGRAADFRVAGMTVTEVVESIAQSNIQFDQLIHEFDRWVHVSFRETDNRREVLRATKQGKKTVYEKYI